MVRYRYWGGLFAVATASSTVNSKRIPWLGLIAFGLLVIAATGLANLPDVQRQSLLQSLQALLRPSVLPTLLLLPLTRKLFHPLTLRPALKVARPLKLHSLLRLVVTPPTRPSLPCQPLLRLAPRASILSLPPVTVVLRVQMAFHVPRIFLLLAATFVRGT